MAAGLTHGTADDRFARTGLGHPGGIAYRLAAGSPARSFERL